MTDSTLHDFSARSIDGRDVPLADFDGEVVLVVNTASQCGFTPQYEGLQALHDEFKAQGFSVLGFPCDQFGGQEPGADDEIAAFCQKNFGVDFPSSPRSRSTATVPTRSTSGCASRRAGSSGARSSGTSRSSSWARTAR